MNRLLVLLSLLIVLSCATRPSSDFRRGDAEAAIDRMNESMERAAAIGNVQGMVDIYADDAVLMPPNDPPITGLDGIRQYWSGLLSAGKIEFDIVTDNVVQSGDLAAERGHYEMTIRPPGRAPISDSGKFVVIWRKIDGRWRNVTDIFNSNRSASAPIQ